MDLALNNLQRLICHITQQTKPNQSDYLRYLLFRFLCLMAYQPSWVTQYQSNPRWRTVVLFNLKLGRRELIPFKAYYSKSESNSKTGVRTRFLGCADQYVNHPTKENYLCYLLCVYASKIKYGKCYPQMLTIVNRLINLFILSAI